MICYFLDQINAYWYSGKLQILFQNNKKVDSDMKKQKVLPKQIYLNRVKCDCVAQKHELINNCLGCGKVVCAQEGEGPCLYCGKVVTRPDTTIIISSTDQSLFPSLSKQQLNKVSQERSMAILHKNKLVERDRSNNTTQNIIDEQMDFYDVSENQWLDQEDRQQAIDRILEKDKFIQKQQFKTKVMFNPITGEFERQQFSYDEEEFKREGQSFISEKQQKDFNERMRKSKQSHVDDRIFKNQKMKQLCQDILKKQKNIPEQVIKRKAELEKRIAETEVILEEQTEAQLQ